jgi:hypothetical protein
VTPMVHDLSLPDAATALLDEAPNLASPATCPLCHAHASVTQAALDAGGAWRCVRCGQYWDGRRLAAVASYAAWVADRDSADRRSTARSGEAAHYRDAPTEPLDG